jgi:hypothetical protein
MGFRFRRRVRLAPGIWFNLSKSGVSTSIGRRGATVNLSSKGSRTTVGLPGSGLSYRSRQVPWGSRSAPGATRQSAGRSVVNLLVGAAIIVALLAYLMR